MWIQLLVKVFVLLVALFYITCLDASNVKIVTNEEPPTNYTLDGKLTGMTTDIVEEIKRQLNLDVMISVYPWARAYSYAKTQPNIVIFTAAKTQKRVDLGFHFIGPVTTRKYILFSKKGTSFNLHSLEDVVKQKLVVGSVREDWRTLFLKQQGVTVVEFPSHPKNLKALIRGRLQLSALSDLEASGMLKIDGLAMDTIEKSYVFKEQSSYIMLSKNTSAETLHRWQQAFIHIQQTEFLHELAKKWSNILKINLEYKADKGLFIKE